MGFDHHISASTPPSLAHRLRSSIYLSCCFAGGGSGGDGEDGRSPVLIRVSAAWIRRKAQELLKVGGKCRSLVSRIKRRHRSHRHFGYDPLSYALNFDEGHDSDEGSGGRGEFLPRGFLSRLPPSPLHPVSAGVVDA
ncbi:uncharacterized protein LOC122042716 [Zingiber officinale]|uniref:uncharacterized protein LOC122042716 n=1 Tax=Zingiber officinale TaxID=94328 RepID=UPI001C4AF74E|nr:uncharacterized protein LOC122042716 [Zingiber officinale]